MKPRRILAGLMLAAGLWGQAAPPEAVPSQDRPLPLPLSGRTATPGTVVTVQNPLPSGLQSVNTITSTVQVQGAYQGSVPSAQNAGPALTLSLDDAVRRGLEFNLGGVGFQNSVRQAEAIRAIERSTLLPQVSAGLLVTEQQVNL